MSDEFMDNRKTKTLFLIPSLKIRGAEKMMVSLVNRLNHNIFSIYIVSLSNDNPLADQIQPSAARFITLPRKARFDLKPAFQIRKIINENKITSIVAQDIFSFFFVWLALCGIRIKPKIFISIHNSKFNNFKDLLKNFAIARLLSGDELFLSVCNSQADYWSTTYRIPRDRFFTIYNGIDIDLFRPESGLSQRMATRANLKLPNNAFVILQVASLTPEKRHEDSFIALQSIINSDVSKSFYLVLVGNGTESSKSQLQRSRTT